MKLSPLPLTLSTLALAFAAAIPAPAAAQMVPRLVSYARPATVASACESGAPGRSQQRTVEYRTNTWEETVTVFEGTGCAPNAALFTLHLGGAYDWNARAAGVVAYRTITPTGAGVAYLEQTCSSSAWSAGVTQPLPSTCAAP